MYSELYLSSNHRSFDSGVPAAGVEKPKFLLMTNPDEKFEERWAIRTREDDGDSSEGEPEKKKPKIIIHESDEISDTPDCQIIETPVKKTPKKTTPKKPKKKLPMVKEKKKGKARKLTNNTYNVVMFEDLKAFGDSVIDEFKIAREKMIVEMKKELGMPNLVPKKKKIGNSQKKKVPIENVNEPAKKPQKGLKEKKVENNQRKLPEAEVKMKVTEPITVLPNASDPHVVSSSPYLTLPSVVPKPQPQTQGNITPLNDRSQIEIGDVNNYFKNGVQPYKPELYRNFSSKNGGFIGNCTQVTNPGFGFAGSFHQGSGNCPSVTEGSNISSMTYLDGTFGDNRSVSLEMNARLSEGIFSSKISDNMQQKLASRDFMSPRLQDLRNENFYLGFRNKQ